MAGSVGDREFEIISGHEFPSTSEERNTWIYSKSNETTHLGGWMCKEEIKEDELGFVLTKIDDSFKPHNITGGVCSVCGYKSAE